MTALRLTGQEPFHRAGQRLGNALRTAITWTAAITLVAGCAAPRWVGKAPPRSSLYYRGTGSASLEQAADREALFALCASIHGVEIEQIIEDYTRELDGPEVGWLEQDYKQWLRTYTKGELPAGARVVERWHGRGAHWAYAVAEQAGQDRTITRMFRDRMSGVRLHSWVPGWAQFQKRQPRKAWAMMTGVGAGLLGGISFAILSNDARERRDQATLQVTRDHYDDLANQRFWLSTGFYALAGVTYITSVIDGYISRVQPYEILTTIDPGGARVALRF